jgi:hypothetical protein
MELGVEYRHEEWPHGLMCGHCPHVFRDGERYLSQLYAFVEDAPLVEIVCLDCAIAPRRCPRWEPPV